MSDELIIRKAGRRGVRESHEPSLMADNFVDGSHTQFIAWDGTHGITQWGMDGNDQYGDCGPAATDHYNVAKANDVGLIDRLGGVGPLSLYFQYGRSLNEGGNEPDEGVDNKTWFAFLYKLKIIEGYMEVPIAKLDFYAQMFNGAVVAQLLDDDAEQDFENKIPWGALKTDTPDPNDGHDTLYIKSAGDGSGVMVTWGALQAFTPEYRERNITDAWVVLDEYDFNRPGVNAAALRAALKALHGVENNPQVKGDEEAKWTELRKQIDKIIGMAIKREAINLIVKELQVAIKILVDDHIV